MERYICQTCGTQHAASARPPERCAICEDERQYVGKEGQRWTTHAALLTRHTLRFEEQGDLLAFGISPDFAISQRSFLLETDAGNILWECQCIVTDEAVRRLEARGGIDRIVISHPHFYAAMVEWSEAFGGVPILLHEADQRWVQRPHPRIETWTGDRLALSDSVTLIRTGGHFAGSTALHWRDGRPGGILFSGDTPQVVSDRRHVSFMYSYPNLIPMRPSAVRAMRARLAPFAYDDVYGYTWGREILGGGRAAVEESFERYLAHVAG